jgi:hypothetical protein
MLSEGILITSSYHIGMFHASENWDEIFTALDLKIAIVFSLLIKWDLNVVSSKNYPQIWLFPVYTFSSSSVIIGRL